MYIYDHNFVYPKTTKQVAKTMKLTIFAFFFFLFSELLTISNGISTSKLFLQQISSQNKYLTKEEHWFNQTLDHFSPYVSNYPFFFLGENGDGIIRWGIEFSRWNECSSSQSIKLLDDLCCYFAKGENPFCEICLSF